MSHPGVPPMSPSPFASPSPSQGWAQSPPPPPPQRDSTRTIAIVALVIGALALIGQLLTMVLPMLFFGLLGFVGFSDDFPEDEMFAPTGVVTFGGGEVSRAADGTVPAGALTSAVRELVGTDDPFLPPASGITCDAAPRVSRDVSVLCRAPADDWYFIVRFANGSGDFEVHAVESPDMMP